MANEITSIGKIKKVPLRQLWKKEDKDFSKWLEENIDYLNDILDFVITIEKREKPVGPFNVDLYGEDNYSKKVIIENQLEKTNHDHLGKVITYLTNLEANTAIWITSNPREEHVKAIEWLNETAPEDVSFFLIKIEAIKIEGQPMAAPLFTIIKEPTKESKQLGAERKEYAERHKLRKEFWAQLLEKSKEKSNLHSGISPGIYSWVGTGAGKSGINFNYVITNKYVSSEIYLDRGKRFVEPNINKNRFDKLLKHKEEIEKITGSSVLWERLDEKRASRISIRLDGAGLRDKDKWDSLQNKMVENMSNLEKATKKLIRQLK
jgi:hypothetical protein